jgi:hypothetical protein
MKIASSSRFLLLQSALLVTACSDSSDHAGSAAIPAAEVLYAGAASRSILPTVSGGRDYLADAPDYVGGVTCQREADDPELRESLGADAAAVHAICYYGQMVGAQIERPSGHYEETNAAGWDLVDDLWHATERLFDGG